MANITLNGDAVVITSALKTEEIATAAKYNPDALTLKVVDELTKTAEVVFSVSTGSESGVSKYGIVFGGTSRDGRGFATATFKFTGSNDPAKAKEEIADKYGFALSQLNKVELAIPAALAQIAADKKAVIDAITIS